MTEAVHRAGGPDVPPSTLYGLLTLRVAVFVVEQRCPYPELDGRDLDPGTVHLWTGPAEAPSASLRLLTDPGGERRIGRVCTAAAARGRGLARTLIGAALAEVGAATCVLDAQAHLTRLYGEFGFVASGAGYDWDGVLHVPMRRTVAVPTRPSDDEDTTT